ncbi:DNA-3-methyladenine glycosylase family protein [Blastococcus sp. SYSU DS0973]
MAEAGPHHRTWNALVPALLEQKVAVVEARRVWHELLRLAGPRGDGAPDARRVLEVTDWEWHRCGLDGARWRALPAVATIAHALEPGRARSATAAQRRMCSIPGIGVWTGAEVVQRVYGDPDTVSVGDYHLENQVGYALTESRNTDDCSLLALSEPWRGHRQRVVRSLLADGPRRPPARATCAPGDCRSR